MKKNISGLKIGDRVKLAAFEDQPEELGTIRSVDGTTAVVQVDGKPTRADDLFREVPLNQVSAAR